MTTHDYNIANQGAAAFRSDVNNLASAILSNNSNATAPTTTAAYMPWADSTNKTQKYRNAADTGWNIKGNLDFDMVITKTTTYTVTEADFGKMILCDASGGAFTITLPAAATLTGGTTTGEGFYVTFKKSDSSSNAITIDGNASETIDGQLATRLLKRYQTITIFCDGSNWYKIGESLNYQSVANQGCVVAYASASTITIGTGTWWDSTNANVIRVTGSMTVNIASSGALGLDTGAEASNTWYYVYLIGKTSDQTAYSAVLSVTNEASAGSITLPAGYDIKRQLPIAIRNDGSSNFLQFFVGPGWPSRPFIGYTLSMTDVSGPTAGTTNIVNSSTLTAMTAQSAASFIPPISKQGRFLMTGNYNTNNSSLKIRPTGSSLANGVASIRVTSTTGLQVLPVDVETNSSQQIDYQITANTSQFYVDVMGYYATEVAA